MADAWLLEGEWEGGPVLARRRTADGWSVYGFSGDGVFGLLIGEPCDERGAR